MLPAVPSFITNLGRPHPKTAQDLARHATAMLAARYTHGFIKNEVLALEALPDLSRSDREAANAHGTDNATAMSLILPWRFAWRQMAETSDYAYAMQMRMYLAKVLEAEVSQGEMTESQAIHIAARLMRDN